MSTTLKMLNQRMLRSVIQTSDVALVVGKPIEEKFYPRQQVNVYDVLSEVKSLLKSEITNKRLTVKIEKMTKVKMMLDKLRIQQIFYNVLLNAI